ncbi:acyl-CoA dehydrogenase family protein [Streptomyces sp. KL116D]|uniref:acyl-CoA dehydrogenase family protein n=1 Tax=Streptomyces sp. KL116D TaxID=3045152 RepID=UPI003556E9F3
MQRRPPWTRCSSTARTREAFGRPIGNFQSLAHAMADLQTEIDSARLLAHRAARSGSGEALHS